jgi:hypothetical protein
MLSARSGAYGKPIMPVLVMMILILKQVFPGPVRPLQDRKQEVLHNSSAAMSLPGLLHQPGVAGQGKLVRLCVGAVLQ